MLSTGGPAGAIAAAALGADARAVRAILFNKTAQTNWSLGWHQDRTIVVERRAPVDEFGPWSIKSGLVQVEPPFAVLERMVTLRIHLDPVDDTNAPLRIAPGSHQMGRIAEADIASVVARTGERVCLAERGDIWLYATPILHASRAADPPRRRRVLEVDYSPDDLPAILRPGLVAPSARLLHGSDTVQWRVGVSRLDRRRASAADQRRSAMHDAQRRPRFAFLFKLGGALALVALANVLFYGEEIAATLGLFAIVWAGVLVPVRSDVRRSRPARLALVAAAAFGLALVDDPGPLDLCLFWIAIASASLLPQHRFDDAIRWGGRLVLHGLLGIATPFRDARRLATARRSKQRTGIGTIVSVLALPLIGGGVFVGLFASANPLIANALAAIRFPDLSAAVFHLLFWLVGVLAVWPNLRPRSTVLASASGRFNNMRATPGVPLVTSVAEAVGRVRGSGEG